MGHKCQQVPAQEKVLINLDGLITTGQKKVDQMIQVFAECEFKFSAHGGQ